MNKMASESPKTGWYFLIISIMIFLTAIYLKPNIFIPSIKILSNTLTRIIPIFILVFIIMFITNYFITKEWLNKHLGKSSGIKSWAIAVTTGIISSGPIYMWFPMLAELKEKGVNEGLIATFLYSRAVKPALFPIMILYFGITFTIVISVVMILFSIIQGITLNKLSEVGI